MAANQSIDAGRDPLVATCAICLCFFLIGLNRLWLPELRYYDESHYVPAALDLLRGERAINREHPMLAKELIALSIKAFGNGPIGWRLGSLVATSLGLFGFMRAQWRLAGSFGATVLFGILVGASFLPLGMARIAMLDPYMFGFVGLASGGFVATTRSPGAAPLQAACAALAIGCAVACKWTALPVYAAMVAVVLFRFLRDAKQWPTLVLFLFLPPAAYLASYIPGMLVRDNPLRWEQVIPLQYVMWRSLGFRIFGHPYASHWWEWLMGGGQMWLYRGTLQGVDRIMVLGQNPIAAIMSLPAATYGAIAGVRRGDAALGYPAVAYFASLMLWAMSLKPVLFLYHYLLPLTFALSIVAQIACNHTGTNGRRAKGLLLALYIGVFLWFFPALTAGDLKGREATYADIPGWGPAPEPRPKPVVTGRARSLNDWAGICLNNPLDKLCWPPESSAGR